MRIGYARVSKEAMSNALSVKVLYDQGKPMEENAKNLNISEATAYRYLNAAKKQFTKA